ncbi:MAG: hypothetical protein COB66_04915 [Coxiella sp. (in: Bacteria)]|nr:MAG: hypothetical protein COB66_04915 [Coxiella sp. (in: g-proteobacteria)]
MKNKRVVIFGETNLAIECVKVLQKRNWDILSVISSDDNVITWSQQNFIKTVNFSDIKAIDDEFYLFSIINSYIIPSCILIKII